MTSWNVNLFQKVCEEREGIRIADILLKFTKFKSCICSHINELIGTGCEEEEGDLIIGCEG